MTMGAATDPGVIASAGRHVLRPATTDDLAACAAIWRDALNDYLGRLAQPEIPDDLGSIHRLYSHLQATDPLTFLVAEQRAVGGPSRGHGGAAGDGERPAIDAFVVAVRRDDLWFLSMLFVRPAAQGKGLGRLLLAAVTPDPATWTGSRATATDTAQPISNGLYASLGMVPRIPLLRLVGLPERPGAFPPLPEGVEAIRFDEVGGAGDGLARAALDAELASLDLDAASFSRAPDRAFVEADGRVGFLFRDRGGQTVGYGYAGESGRVGPVVVREADLLGPVVGHLVHVVRPRGAFGIWMPGTAGDAVVPLLRSGFRLEAFPILLCWDRPFADFARFIPMSPGLL